MLSPKIWRGFFAGLWFAAAAIIPVGFSLYLSWQSPLRELVINVVCLPILIAGGCGWFLGSTILNPEAKKSAIRAAVRGFVIGILSYLLLITAFAAINILPTGHLFAALAYIAVAFGWGLFFELVIGLLGAVAGVLLYLLRWKFIEGRSD